MGNESRVEIQGAGDGNSNSPWDPPESWPTTPPSGETYSAEWGTATPLESAARMDTLMDEQQTPRRGKALGFLPRWRSMTWLIAVSNLLVVLEVVRTPRATSAAASQ